VPSGMGDTTGTKSMPRGDFAPPTVLLGSAGFGLEYGVSAGAEARVMLAGLGGGALPPDGGFAPPTAILPKIALAILPGAAADLAAAGTGGGALPPDGGFAPPAAILPKIALAELGAAADLAAAGTGGGEAVASLAGASDFRLGIRSPELMRTPRRTARAALDAKRDQTACTHTAAATSLSSLTLCASSRPLWPRTSNRGHWTKKLLGLRRLRTPHATCQPCVALAMHAMLQSMQVHLPNHNQQSNLITIMH